MDNKDYWKKLYNKKTWVYYWMEQEMDAVALITHQLYHSVEEGRFQTVVVIVEKTSGYYFSVIGIVSKEVLTKAQLQDIIDGVPGNPLNDKHWAKGR